MTPSITRDAYDERIDVQECKSDLFWRLTGITSALGGGGPGTQNSYTFTCTKLSTVYDKSFLVYQVFLLNFCCWIFNQ